MNTWLFGGAAVAVLASAWRYFLWFFNYVRSYVVVTVTFADGHAREMLCLYLRQHAKQHKMSGRLFYAYEFTRKSTGRTSVEVVESITDGGLYWIGKVPLWVSRDNHHNMSVTFLRFFTNCEQLALQAVKEFNEFHTADATRQSRFYVNYLRGRGFRDMVVMAKDSDAPGEIPHASFSAPNPSASYLPPSYQLIGGDASDIGIPDSSVVTFGTSSLLLPESAMRFVYMARRWYQSRDWYKEHKIPWKLGAHIVGPPGTGKSSFVRALAYDLKIPVQAFELSSMDNSEFTQSWREVRSSSPCIALFEDFDGVFNGRKVVNEKQTLSFDVILQCLSGVDETDGVILIVTTNHPDSLDSAITRSGRAGYKIELGPLTYGQCVELTEGMLASWPGESVRLVNYLICDSDGDPSACTDDTLTGLTGALIVEKASERALELIQNNVDFGGK